MIKRTERALKMAEKTGGKSGLNCIAELDPTALEQAKSMEQSNVKDNIDVKGLHTTAGSLALEDNIALSDAPIIRNLRKNGAEFFRYIKTVLCYERGTISGSETEVS